MYRRQLSVFVLMVVCLSIFSGCDPVLEERKRNGLEVEPFAPREYIRIRQLEDTDPLRERIFAQELKMWADGREQVQDAVLVKRESNVYVGILSSSELAKETEESVRKLLTGWLQFPDVEQVFLTYDSKQTQDLMNHPDLPEERMRQYSWILLGTQQPVN